MQKQTPRVVLKKGVVKVFAKFTGKHPCWSLTRPKGLQLYQKMNPTQVCFGNFAEILKAPIL